MPIDVLWVTINPESTQSFEFAASTAATGMDGSSFGGSARPRSSGRDSTGGGRTTSRRGTFSGGGSSSVRSGDVDYGPDTVLIEIFGCINIFAPPDKEKISGSSGT
jgi:hypothetical protein